MEMYDFIDTQVENNDKLTSPGELFFVVCISPNVTLCSPHTSSHILIFWDQTTGKQVT